MDGSAANLAICLRGSFETALHHHPPWRRMTLRDFAGNESRSINVSSNSPNCVSALSCRKSARDQCDVPRDKISPDDESKKKSIFFHYQA